MEGNWGREWERCVPHLEQTIVKRVRTFTRQKSKHVSARSELSKAEALRVPHLHVNVEREFKLISSKTDTHVMTRWEQGQTVKREAQCTRERTGIKGQRGDGTVAVFSFLLFLFFQYSYNENILNLFLAEAWLT